MPNEYELKRFNADRVQDRKVDELIGLCRGVTADGSIVKSEAEYIIKWLESNDTIINDYPANILYDRIKEMLSDDVLDDDEQKELLEMLDSLTGDKPIHESIESMSSTLPLNNPSPDVLIEGNTFVLTGTFVSGKRADVERLLKDLGGLTGKNVTNTTKYLVIGIIGSDNWIHSSFGRKIEKAVDLREGKDTGICIISEEHLMQFV
jgi:NAD-dependent DNA ligase